ncbi:hypothetical protein QR680_007265 [Steinernema hermaphroditum]|uniref:Regulatory protein zeste n=1 Tax=Steinernema hermaphroditum TaxID=289476 RepID=A0AA39HYB4_9BILA|nr:hypothetical protein QR680_007265 [Steinernema hermaphroditum]
MTPTNEATTPSNPETPTNHRNGSSVLSSGIMRSEQTLMLVQLYHRNHKTMTSCSHDVEGRKTKQQLWAEIASELNAKYETAFSVEQFKKKLQNIQCTARMKIQAEKRNRTHGLSANQKYSQAELEFIRLFEYHNAPQNLLSSDVPQTNLLESLGIYADENGYHLGAPSNGDSESDSEAAQQLLLALGVGMQHNDSGIFDTSARSPSEQSDQFDVSREIQHLSTTMRHQANGSLLPQEERHWRENILKSQEMILQNQVRFEEMLKDRKREIELEERKLAAINSLSDRVARLCDILSSFENSLRSTKTSACLTPSSLIPVFHFVHGPSSAVISHEPVCGLCPSTCPPETMTADRVFWALFIALLSDVSALPPSPAKINSFALTKHVRFKHFKFTKKVLFKNAPSSFNDYHEDFNLNLLFVADHSMFEAFHELALHDEFSAQYALQQYLRGVFEEMRVIYNRLIFFKDRRINLHLSGTFIARREDDCPLKTLQGELRKDLNETNFDDDYSAGNDSDSTVMSLSISALDAVNRVHVWIRKFAHLLPFHDHVILLTKFDLLSSRNDSATQGMAYVGAMCALGDSSSVVEDIGGLTTAVIAAHELAHSLGAYHDGSGEAKDCHRTLNYLMSPVASGTEDSRSFANSLLLSQCSTKQIENFLRSKQSACLRKRVASKEKHKVKKAVDIEQTNKIRPGEIFDKNRQCQLAYGPHYGVCLNREYGKLGDPCRRLWCKNRLHKRFSPCETRSYFPAMDGTPCGFQKWCISGSCVANIRFYKKDCNDVNSSFCQTLNLDNFCETETFGKICCSSCENHKHYSRRTLKKQRKKVPSVILNTFASNNSTDL